MEVETEVEKEGKMSDGCLFCLVIYYRFSYYLSCDYIICCHL